MAVFRPPLSGELSLAAFRRFRYAIRKHPLIHSVGSFPAGAFRKLFGVSFLAGTFRDHFHPTGVISAPVISGGFPWAFRRAFTEFPCQIRASPVHVALASLPVIQLLRNDL